MLRTLCFSVLVLASACVERFEPVDQAELQTQTQPVHTVCGPEQTLHGIDVSSWQASIDWEQVATTELAHFAYLRLGDGLGTDEQFARNWAETRRVGIPRGAYHFFRPAVDALAQAKHFMAVIEKNGGMLDDDLPPMLDIEANGNKPLAVIQAGIRTWLEHVEAATGKQAVIYTGSYFWDDNKLGTAFADHHLWTAHYTAAPCPFVPDAWSSWLLWQYSATGRVAGISGDVDMNRFAGTPRELELWPRCSAYRPIESCIPPSWWCEPITQLNDWGLLSLGCDAFLSADRFDRAEWARLLGSALQVETTEAFALCRLPYVDVPSDAPYARYVAALAALDYGQGQSVFSTDGVLFEPAHHPSRCEAVEMLARTWNLPPAPQLLLLYTDRESLPSWCVDPLQRVAALDLVVHEAVAFRPHDAITVGEGALLLERSIQRMGRPTPGPGDFFEPSCDSDCEPLCQPAQGQCVDEAITVCELGANGCLGWAQPTLCGLRQGCREGVCVELCLDECEFEQVSCEGNGVRDCLPDEQGCLYWGPVASCSAQQSCFEGACVSGCVGGDCEPLDPEPELLPEELIEEQGEFRPNGDADHACGCRLRANTTTRAPLGLLALLMALVLFVASRSRR